MARARSINDVLDDDSGATAVTRQVAAQPLPKPAATPPAQRVATATETATAAEELPPATRPPVRTTLDLRAEEYEAFAGWCAEVGKDVGRSRARGQQVMRVLVRRLLSDPKLARQVAADLKKDAGQLNRRY